MTLADLGALIAERHTTDVFRLETRDRYAAASDGDNFARYLRGEPEPAVEDRPWLSRLRTDVAAGRRWRKVHVVRGDLSDYERYEFEWGFRGTVSAGEDVRVLDVTTESRLDEQVGDFFVIDHELVILTHYGSDDRHTGAELVEAREAAALIAVRDLAWQRSVPFLDWWTTHPQFHRTRQAA